MKGEENFVVWLLQQRHRPDIVGDLGRHIAQDLQMQCLSSSEASRISWLVRHSLEVHGIDIRDSLAYALAVYQRMVPQPRGRFRWRRR